MIFESRHVINPECANMDEYAMYGGHPGRCEYKDDYEWKYDKVKLASVKNGRRLYKKIKKAGKFRYSRSD
jgi:hypothetical protein